MRPCGCLADPAVFGHTCEQYGPPWLAAALRRRREARERIFAAARLIRPHTEGDTAC